MHDIFKNTPLARVLIISPSIERLSSAERYWLTHLPGGTTCWLGKDRPQLAQLILGDCQSARRDLRYLGAIDLLVADDCYNVSPFIGTKRYAEIIETLQRRNRAIDIREYPAAPMLGLSNQVKKFWICGKTPIISTHSYEGLSIYQNELLVGCYHKNIEEHFFCRNCGRFRGFVK